jgi:acetylornithine/succinyldiaminopimelate/putrescine aminotransferase
VLILPAGVHGNCIRFLAPLVITDEQLDEALDVLESCIVEVAGSGLGAPHGVDAKALADPT